MDDENRKQEDDYDVGDGKQGKREKERDDENIGSISKFYFGSSAERAPLLHGEAALRVKAESLSLILSPEDIKFQQWLKLTQRSEPSWSAKSAYCERNMLFTVYSCVFVKSWGGLYCIRRTSVFCCYYRKIREKIPPVFARATEGVCIFSLYLPRLS